MYIVLEENLIYNKKEKRLYKDENDLKLPVKVLDLLELFIENEKKIISKDMIVDRLWSKSQTHSDGSIRVYINSLKNIFEKKQNVITNIKALIQRGNIPIRGPKLYTIIETIYKSMLFLSVSSIFLYKIEYKKVIDKNPTIKSEKFFGSISYKINPKIPKKA